MTIDQDTQAAKYLAGLKDELASQTDPERRKVIQAEIDRVSPPAEPKRASRPVRDQPQA